MPKTYSRPHIMQTDPTTFGGVIYPSDFNTESRWKTRMSGSLTASRIVQDQKFDAACKRNGEKRNARG